VAAGTDRTENAASNSSSTVACVSVATITLRLFIHRLETRLFTDPFPSNGCLCWLHSSGHDTFAVQLTIPSMGQIKHRRMSE
jgi:hypothetical protein